MKCIANIKRSSIRVARGIKTLSCFCSLFAIMLGWLECKCGCKSMCKKLFQARVKCPYIHQSHNLSSLTENKIIRSTWPLASGYEKNKFPSYSILLFSKGKLWVKSLSRFLSSIIWKKLSAWRVEDECRYTLHRQEELVQKIHYLHLSRIKIIHPQLTGIKC